jgi:predicted DNA-binding protein
MVRLQIQLEEEQAKALRQISREQGRPVAELVRRAVDVLLRSRGQPSREDLKRRAMEVIGRFHSGKSDVSSQHDRYLADAYRR